MALISTNPFDRERLRTDDHYTQRYSGEVVDADDPERLYRARVRVRGKFDNLADDELPWAIPSASYIFGGNGGGTISYPKVGTEVFVTFFEGDIYMPVYHAAVVLDENMVSEVSESYENSHCLLWDSDEDVKMYYNPDQGMYYYQRGSIINVRNDLSILIQHEGTQSVIELSGGNITITSDNRTDVTSETEITINSNRVHVNGVQTDIGANPIYSAVNGELLMALLKVVASAVDAKYPPTPNTLAQIVQQFEQLILSETVNTTP